MAGIRFASDDVFPCVPWLCETVVGADIVQVVCRDYTAGL